MSHAGNLRRAQDFKPVAHRGLHHEDLPRFLRPDSRHPDEGIQLHRELRVRGRYSICRGISPRAPPAAPMEPLVNTRRPGRELYDLVEDPIGVAQPAGLRRHRQGRSNRRRARAAPRRLAAKDQRRHTVGFRRHPNCGALHRNLPTNSRPDRSPAGRRSPPNEASKTTTDPDAIVSLTVIAIVRGHAKRFDCG